MEKLKNAKIPQDSFNPTLFRQPSLVEGGLRPAAYRATTSSGSNNNGGDEEEGLKTEKRSHYRDQSLHSIAMERNSDSLSASDFNPSSLHSAALLSSLENSNGVGSLDANRNDAQAHSSSFTTPPRHSHSASEHSYQHHTVHSHAGDTSQLSIDANFIDEDMEIEKEVNDFLENNGSILSPAVSRNSHRSSLGAILRLTTGRSSHQTNENAPILDETEVSNKLNK